jgi:hypothetical protein
MPQQTNVLLCPRHLHRTFAIHLERPSITRAEHTGKWPTLLYISLYWSYSQLACSTILEFSSPPILGISILSVFPRHGGLQPPFRWVTFKSLKTWMSHFQVSRDLHESLSSLSRLGWVTFKSLKTWMRLSLKSLKTWMRLSLNSLSSLSRLGWGLERRGTASLSSSVDCCYSNLHDLLRVKSRACSYNL